MKDWLLAPRWVWLRFKSAEMWRSISGPKRAMSLSLLATVDSVEDPSTLGLVYHRQCYQAFTNKTNVQFALTKAIASLKVDDPSEVNALFWVHQT